MDLQKIKAILLTILKRIARFGYSVYKKLSGFFEKLFEHLPISAKFRRMAAMITLSLLLVVVVVAAVPVFKAVTAATGSVIEAIIQEVTLPDPEEEDTADVSSVYVDRNASAPVLNQVLPEVMEVPQNDIINIPSGATPFRFGEAELLKLQRLMVFTEKCQSFDYNDTDKDVGMALTAYRLLVETNDTNLSLNSDPYYYTVRHLHLQKYINQLFGRNLSSTENLGDIYYTDDQYLYFAKPGEPTAVSGYISEAYALGDNYYKITGIVTRGFANEEGRYSRKISLILKKNSEALYGYYIVSVVNEPMTYTYLDSLLKTLPPDENALLHFGQQSAGNNTQSDTASQDPQDTTASTVSGEDATTLPQEDTSSTAPVESVTQPEADKKEKVSLSKVEESALLTLLQAIPSATTDFDVTNDSASPIQMLTAHLLLCEESGIDYTTQLTAHTYGEINQKAEKLFGQKIASIQPNMNEIVYRLDPYISTGKTEFKNLEIYALGGDRYLLECDLNGYSNLLLEEPDSKYTYSAVLESSNSAQFGFYLKSQKCVMK